MQVKAPQRETTFLDLGSRNKPSGFCIIPSDYKSPAEVSNFGISCAKPVSQQQQQINSCETQGIKKKSAAEIPMGTILNREIRTANPIFNTRDAGTSRFMIEPQRTNNLEPITDEQLEREYAAADAIDIPLETAFYDYGPFQTFASPCPKR